MSEYHFYDRPLRVQGVGVDPNEAAVGRCTDCGGPLDGDGWHQSEFADCHIATAQQEAAAFIKEGPDE